MDLFVRDANEAGTVLGRELLQTALDSIVDDPEGLLVIHWTSMAGRNRVSAAFEPPTPAGALPPSAAAPARLGAEGTP